MLRRKRGRDNHFVPPVMALTVGLTSLGLVLVLAIIPWLFRPPASTEFHSKSGAIDTAMDVTANMEEGGVLTVFLNLQSNGTGGFEPIVEIVMPDHAVSAPAALLSAGPGAYQVRAVLPMAGRWVVSIRVDDQRLEIPVDF